MKKGQKIKASKRGRTEDGNMKKVQTALAQAVYGI